MKAKKRKPRKKTKNFWDDRIKKIIRERREMAELNAEILAFQRKVGKKNFDKHRILMGRILEADLAISLAQAYRMARAA